MLFLFIYFQSLFVHHVALKLGLIPLRSLTVSSMTGHVQPYYLIVRNLYSWVKINALTSLHIQILNYTRVYPPEKKNVVCSDVLSG